MPRICIDCRYVGTLPSGIGEVAARLAAHAPGLAPDLDFLLLKSPDERAPLSLAPNVAEQTVAFHPNGPASMWLLPLITDLANVNLFHAPSNILPAGLQMPCVTTVHDLMWLDDPGLCAPGRFGRLETAFYAHGIGRALRRSAAIAVVSDATRRAIVARAPKVAERIALTLPGVSSDFCPITPDLDTLAELGVNSARRYILTVGQNAPYKNHAGALRAFAAAFSSRSEFNLVLVQRRGKRSDELMQLAGDLGISDRLVIPRPPVSRKQLVQLYAQAVALLHPSLCEGFGMPLAEAMACGCPVVASNVSAMPEVTAGAALLADPHDPEALAACLLRVADEPRLARSMRDKGLARAAQLGWSAFAAANVAIYRRLLASA